MKIQDPVLNKKKGENDDAEENSDEGLHSPKTSGPFHKTEGNPRAQRGCDQAL